MQQHHLDNLPERELFPGLLAKLVHSERMTIAHLRIVQGAVVRLHHHPHDQVSNVISGEFEFTLGDETTRCGPGSVLVIPSETPHSGRALTDCYIIDVFSPVREDYR